MRYAQLIIQQSAIWIFAIVFWGLMREFGHEVVDGPSFPSFGYLATAYLSMGLTAGLIFGTADFFLEKLPSSQTSFRTSILTGLATQFVLIILATNIGIYIFTITEGSTLRWQIFSNFLFSKEMLLVVFYCLIVSYFTQFLKQISKKFGPGNLWKMLTGEFHSPKETEKIFMFLDLKSSTSIAEQIGHIQYSKLIQDCFQDLIVVQKYHTEIYQYVGDEVVLIWGVEKGLKNANCLHAFFAFKNRLTERAVYYKTKYGVFPKFKAGLNIGKIVVTEIGIIKKEIAYHGDTINTAARIQGECNHYEKEMLISESLNDRLNQNKQFVFTNMGNILLKGKSQEIAIYSVEKV